MSHRRGFRGAGSCAYPYITSRRTRRRGGGRAPGTDRDPGPELRGVGGLSEGFRLNYLSVTASMSGSWLYRRRRPEPLVGRIRASGTGATQGERSLRPGA